MYDSGDHRCAAAVTGCAGFLGSHLTDRLLAEGWHVSGIDSLVCGSLTNLKEAFASGRFVFSRHDVTVPYRAEGTLLFNLACPASPPRYQRDPVHTFKTSVLGTLNAVEVARANGARLIHTSTSEVYGDPELHPQSESYRGSVNPIGPRACYDEGKRAAETLLFDHLRVHGLDIGVCRIFNTYGPRMDPFDGRIVSNFLRQALTGEPLTVYGDGSQTRSFCYVDDLIDGLWRLAKARKVTGPINLGNPCEITVLELAETIMDLVGNRVDVRFQPLPEDDPARRRPDITLAREELGWEPKVTLAEGLRRTLDDFDNLLTSRKSFDHTLQGAGRLSITAAE